MSCPHGMPTPASCRDCMQDGWVPPVRRWEKIGEPFKALFHSRCSCDVRINAGDRIQRWDFGDQTFYRHVGCPAEAVR